MMMMIVLVIMIMAMKNYVHHHCRVNDKHRSEIVRTVGLSEKAHEFVISAGDQKLQNTIWEKSFTHICPWVNSCLKTSLIQICFFDVDSVSNSLCQMGSNT